MWLLTYFRLRLEIIWLGKMTSFLAMVNLCRQRQLPWECIIFKLTFASSAGGSVFQENGWLTTARVRKEQLKLDFYSIYTHILQNLRAWNDKIYSSRFLIQGRRWQRSVTQKVTEWVHIENLAKFYRFHITKQEFTFDNVNIFVARYFYTKHDTKPKISNPFEEDSLASVKNI